MEVMVVFLLCGHGSVIYRRFTATSFDATSHSHTSPGSLCWLQYHNHYPITPQCRNELYNVHFQPPLTSVGHYPLTRSPRNKKENRSGTLPDTSHTLDLVQETAVTVDVAGDKSADGMERATKEDDNQVDWYEDDERDYSL